MFYLYRRELDAAAENEGVRYQSAVSERRAERDTWMRVLPPATIGAGEIVMDAVQAAFTGYGEVQPSESGMVKGLAGSRGTVRGTARLVLTLDEADKLNPGDILVTYATAPMWTPLFAVASAVVTDTGGPLAHCAVVAREYGIPAVVGTRVATSEIPDGAVITVDGSAGVVTIER